jgi:hypothetical protein
LTDGAVPFGSGERMLVVSVLTDLLQCSFCLRTRKRIVGPNRLLENMKRVLAMRVMAQCPQCIAAPKAGAVSYLQKDGKSGRIRFPPKRGCGLVTSLEVDRIGDIQQSFYAKRPPAPPSGDALRCGRPR